MDDTEYEMHDAPPARGFFRRAWGRMQQYLDWVFDRADEYAVVIRKEGELFLGAALIVIGLLGYNTGKFCDGNTADYLSCTRPTAYHYYSFVDIAFVVFGVTLLLLWALRRR